MTEQTVVPTVIVTIGRNVTGGKLDDQEWTAYVSSVRDIFSGIALEIWTDAAYVGQWDGVTEDAHVWYGATVDDVDLFTLSDRLAFVAERYRQQGIGLATGRSTLVGPALGPADSLLSLAEYVRGAA